MADLRDAVRLLRGALDALAANAQLAQDKVLRLNVREARSSLALRVQQLSPATTASPVRVMGCVSPRMDTQASATSVADFGVRPCPCTAYL